MNVSGFRSRTRRKSISVSATSPSNFRANLAPKPPAARRSTTSKPMLCRVPSYLLPGLPRPTTSFSMEVVGSRSSVSAWDSGSTLLLLVFALGLDDLGLRGGLGLGRRGGLDRGGAGDDVDE